MVTPAGSLTVVKLVQEEKAPSGIVFTLEGMVTLGSDSQPENAKTPRVVRDEGSVKLVNGHP